MGALATLQAAVLDIAHLVRVATRQHLGHQAVVIRRLITRMGALKRVPVLGKDLLEDTPVPRGLWHHRGAPSWGDELLTVQRLYHASSASSTPHRPVLGQPSLASFVLESRGLPGSGKCKILCYEQMSSSQRPNAGRRLWRAHHPRWSCTQGLRIISSTPPCGLRGALSSC